jgi:hypothetical protein
MTGTVAIAHEFAGQHQDLWIGVSLLEADAGSDQGDEVGWVDGSPAVLSGFDELERRRDACGPR